MAIIQASEYNADYFHSGSSQNPHPEGYYDYSLTEHMNQELDGFLSSLSPVVAGNQKVLELGCAKGFLVQRLRDLGLDAYGLDWSQYAIDNSPLEVAPYLSVGDMRDLSAYSNKEFDYVISVRSLNCVDEADIPSLISDITRIAKKQIHIIDEPSYGTSNYYILKSVGDWLTYGFPKSTVVVSYQTRQEGVK